MDITSIYGLGIGLSAFLIIGLFHPIVIKAEYYLGTKSWWIFLFLGVIAAIFSFFISNLRSEERRVGKECVSTC